jgi:hypothetical protein
MDKITTYRQLIKDILAEDAQYKPSHGEIEPLLVFDDEHDSYQLMYVGWDGYRRVHTAIIHIRLHNNKIWIEQDGTEEGVANTLLGAGVPKEDIVLAFHSPAKRPFTEFAIA